MLEAIQSHFYSTHFASPVPLLYCSDFVQYVLPELDICAPIMCIKMRSCLQVACVHYIRVCNMHVCDRQQKRDSLLERKGDNAQRKCAVIMIFFFPFAVR